MTVPAKPRRTDATTMLRAELDRLVAIDEQRNAHQAALNQLQSQRDMQVGRMQVLAEQVGIDLETFVTDDLARRSNPALREQR